MPEIIRLKDLRKHTPKTNISAKYYNSKSWKTLRNSYIRSHPLCERCLENGITKPAEHIHHVTPFLRGLTDESRWTLLLDQDNLMALCRDCHSKVHEGQKMF